MQYLSQHCQYYRPEDIFMDLKKVGSGHFAEVHKAKHKSSGLTCAVKEIDKKKLTHKEISFLRNELLIVSMIRHPYITEIREVYEQKDKIWISMELITGGELIKYIEKNELTEKEIAMIMK